MQKYIFLSLLIHIGVAVALINWSGVSVSEWTQSLLSRLSTDPMDEPLEIQQEATAQIPIEKKSDPVKSNKVKPKVKKQKVKKTISKTPKKKKTPSSQKPKSQFKPSVQKKTPPIENFSKTDTNSKNKNFDEAITQASNSKTDPVTKPEVQYNPAEDLSAIEQEISTPPDNSKPANIKEENIFKPTDKNAIETVSDNKEEKPEFSVNRDFEEINTDPQDLKDIIKEPPPKTEVKGSQMLIPVPGNPEWAYPQQARQNKNEGSVFLKYFVDDTGFVDKIQLLKSSGYSILDNEALRIMARQRYQPGQSGWYKHQVDFKLKNM